MVSKAWLIIWVSHCQSVTAPVQCRLRPTLDFVIGLWKRWLSTFPRQLPWTPWLSVQRLFCLTILFLLTSVCTTFWKYFARREYARRCFLSCHCMHPTCLTFSKCAVFAASVHGDAWIARTSCSACNMYRY